jgi:hypothetical protein
LCYQIDICGKKNEPLTLCCLGRRQAKGGGTNEGKGHFTVFFKLFSSEMS